MSRRDELINHYPGTEDDLLFLDPEYFDEAILGIAQRAGGFLSVCYSEPKIIEMLIRNERMSPDEAVEHYSFNMLSAYVGEATPVFVDETVFKK